MNKRSTPTSPAVSRTGQLHPGEPLIFVEVALTNGLADAVQPLLAREGVPARAQDADTAIFYSISNCQDGLRGVSFGNS